MQIHRILGILVTLLEKEKVTAPQLAKQFEVSRRTIQRDLDSILMAGIPILTSQGYNGGISLEHGYSIDKTLFTVDEIDAIVTGLGSIESVSEGKQLSYLFDKLAHKKNESYQTHDKIRIDLASHYKDTLTPKIALIKKVIELKQCIGFDYYAKQETRREIEPYLLIYTYANWYVFGYCLTRCDFRYFKLNRLWKLSLSEKACQEREIPEVELHFETFYTNEIKLIASFAKTEKYRLIEEYGLDSFYERENDLLFETSFNTLETLVSWILSFNENVEVIEPQAARASLKAIATKLYQLYEEHDE